MSRLFIVVRLEIGRGLDPQAGQLPRLDQPATTDLLVGLMIVPPAMEMLLGLPIHPPQQVLHRPDTRGGGGRCDRDLRHMGVVDGGELDLTVDHLPDHRQNLVLAAGDAAGRLVLLGQGAEAVQRRVVGMAGVVKRPVLGVHRMDTPGEQRLDLFDGKQPFGVCHWLPRWLP